jgi:hypothetical protein
MPSIALHVRRPATDAGNHVSPESIKPLFRGNGDTDYLCGNCGAVIAANMAPNQHVIVDTATCSACGAENEFPPHLRA